LAINKGADWIELKDRNNKAFDPLIENQFVANQKFALK